MHRHEVWASDDTIQTRQGCVPEACGSGAGSLKIEVSFGVGSFGHLRQVKESGRQVQHLRSWHLPSLVGALGPVAGLS